MNKKTRTKIVLKPWARWLLIAVAVALLGLVAYVVTNAIVGDDDGTPYRKSDSDLSKQVPDNPERYTTNGKNVDKVCSILDGVYLTSDDQAKALDKNLFGFYQGLKQENGNVAGFVKRLHEDPSDLDFLNTYLTEEIVEECADR